MKMNIRRILDVLITLLSCLRNGNNTRGNG